MSPVYGYIQSPTGGTIILLGELKPNIVFRTENLQIVPLRNRFFTRLHMEYPLLVLAVQLWDAIFRSKVLFALV